MLYDKIVLASASPRRKELLLNLGLKFEVFVSDVDETCDIISPKELTEHLSRIKAENVFKKFTNSLIISADTVVFLPQKGIFGKPKDAKEAEEMLLSLSGKTHEVFTGVTVADRFSSETFSSKTQVKFRELDISEIKGYISLQKPFDKAGAYAIQEKAGIFVEYIIGDYYNIVGLPLTPLYNILRKKGVIFWE